jgi:membrane-bound serine protease (ClpP class)
MKKWVLTGMGGAAAFLVALLILRMGFLWAVGIGLIVWLILTLVLPEPVPEAPIVAGLTQREVQETVRDAQAKVRRLRSLGRKMPTAKVRLRVSDIAQVAEVIVDGLERDPKDIKPARRFLDYYLDATITVVERYADLLARGGSGAEVHEVLGRFDGLLDAIHATFEKQRDRLLRDDVLDLDTDITVLKRMMDMEGL